MSDDPSEVFGAVASAYARHRLTYPPAFFQALADLLPRGALVWDCGCGSGQASLDLANRGLRVIATDASARQLAKASPHPRVVYRLAAWMPWWLLPASTGSSWRLSMPRCSASAALEAWWPGSAICR